ncbi:hypothetical protein J3S90_07260 [Flavobacterium sp. P4023]|uniref:Uncharacterized protein n=1 Tax=Flavobacterium flabelliforme TaxID=2816119 RepID=A0ABS5CSJ5_9FLAO|nr:hypothetical protein [Flavobacterium flabelliforme]
MYTLFICNKFRKKIANLQFNNQDYAKNI